MEFLGAMKLDSKLKKKKKEAKSFLNKDQTIKINTIIHSASVATGAIGFAGAQIPGADNIAIVPIQVTMVIGIGKVLNLDITRSSATGVLTAVAATMVGRAGSQMLFGWFPVIGNILNATTASIITEIAGWSTVVYLKTLSDSELRKMKSIKDEAKINEQAKKYAETEKIKLQMEKVKEVMKEYEEFERYMLGAFAIGLAAANVDGVVHDDEKEKLELLINGIGGEAIPKKLRTIIDKMFVEIPSLSDALRIIHKVDYKYWETYDSIVCLMLDEHWGENDKVQEFFTSWNRHYQKVAGGKKWIDML